MPDKPTIVHYVQRPKRAPRKKVKAAALQVPVIVTSTSRKQAKLARVDRATEPGDDPEATARVKAFLARMIRPP